MGLNSLAAALETTMGTLIAMVAVLLPERSAPFYTHGYPYNLSQSSKY
jgi:hypothetical protein